jgi:hypothetical protein
MDEAFLHGGKAEETVRLPHTVKEVPLHHADPASYQMTAGYRRHLTFDGRTERESVTSCSLTEQLILQQLYFNGSRNCWNTKMDIPASGLRSRI